MNTKLLLIIPAYNEEANIVRVIENIRTHFPDYDYVVINDGSTDRTSSICHTNGYHIVDLPVNLGLAGAFQTGMKYAYYNKYDCAIQFDADGQHRPEFIEAMRLEMEKGYDLVIGSRFVTEKKPWNARMLGSRLISAAIRLTTRKKIQDPTSGMRLYNSEVFKEFAANINYGPEPDTVSYLLKKGKRVSEVQVNMDERTAGESYLNISRSISYMLQMLLSILLIQRVRRAK